MKQNNHVKNRTPENRERDINEWPSPAKKGHLIVLGGTRGKKGREVGAPPKSVNVKSNEEKGQQTKRKTNSGGDAQRGYRESRKKLHGASAAGGGRRKSMGLKRKKREHTYINKQRRPQKKRTGERSKGKQDMRKRRGLKRRHYQNRAHKTLPCQRKKKKCNQ